MKQIQQWFVRIKLIVLLTFLPARRAFGSWGDHWRKNVTPGTRRRQRDRQPQPAQRRTGTEAPKVEGCLKCHGQYRADAPLQRDAAMFWTARRRQRRSGPDLHRVSRRQSGSDDAKRRSRSAPVSKRVGMQERRLLEPQSGAHEHADRKGKQRLCPLCKSRRFSRHQPVLRRMSRRSKHVTSHRG